MTAEWKLLCVDAINICGRKNIDCLKCEVRCTEIIKAAQHKLLQHLMKQAQVNEITEGFMVTSLYIKELKDMLSQLEAK
jgi:hypothetical protein